MKAHAKKYTKEWLSSHNELKTEHSIGLQLIAPEKKVKASKSLLRFIEYVFHYLFAARVIRRWGPGKGEWEEVLNKNRFGEL